MDINYIPMAKGFVDLAAVLNWHTRRVLYRRLSITMESSVCTTWKKTLKKCGAAEVYNTVQGSQFIFEAFTRVLLDKGIAISMDSRGAWRDNVFVQRL